MKPGDTDRPRDVFVRTVALMGTVVTIQVVGHGPDAGHPLDPHAAIDRAFAWFREIEACCSRFDSDSEVQRLAARVGVAVPVSETLYEAVQFAIAVAGDTGGAFDPTVGHRMEAAGFDSDYRTGRTLRTNVTPGAPVSYRDVLLDPDRGTITLVRPLMLDLGAVAKGLAIDTAARELQPFEHFAIDAGGDLYLGGSNPSGVPWSIGIRHPRDQSQVIETLRVSNLAVCTSGDYARPSRRGQADVHHIVDPRTTGSPSALASVTVVAPMAMLADALGTAAFVLGPAAGIQLLERHGVEGLLVTPALERHATSGMAAHYHPAATAGLRAGAPFAS
jgi:thiamine biosynthesis lipoprotein